MNKPIAPDAPDIESTDTVPEYSPLPSETPAPQGPLPD